MKSYSLIIAICLTATILISCNTSEKAQENASPEQATAFTQRLNTFVDSVKIYNENWANTYQELVKSKNADFAPLTQVRKNYRTFIDQSIEDLNKMKDVGKYSRELRASFVEFLNVQKTNIDKYLIKFEELQNADSTKIREVFQIIENEGFASQLAERDAMIKINQFKKLYQKENNITTPKKIEQTAPIDSIKK